jgi:hypothetical protein
MLEKPSLCNKFLFMPFVGWEHVRHMPLAILAKKASRKKRNQIELLTKKSSFICENLKILN